MSCLPSSIPSFLFGEFLAGDIAQLARAAALQAVGRGFKSHYLHEADGQHRGPLARCSLTRRGKGKQKEALCAF